MIHFKRAASMFFVLLLVLTTGLVIIIFARGYRFTLGNKKLKSKGILVANSAPTNAQIYINNKFKALTSENIYLTPDYYNVEIKKEGYSNWKKRFSIRGEVVSRVDAQLFSINPSLAPLTNKGIVNPFLSPTKEKVAYLVLADKNQLETEVGIEETGGIFVSNINSQTFSLFKQRSLVIPYSELPLELAPEKTRFIFSNDEKNLLVFLYDQYENLIKVLLVSVNGSKEYFDTTLSYQLLLDKWWVQNQELQNKILSAFKKKINTQLKDNVYIIGIAKDKSKILYFALKQATLPKVIEPPLIGSVPTQEQRAILPANFYVYDQKEDKNFVLNIFDQAEKQTNVQFLNSILALEALSEANWFQFNSVFAKLAWYGDSRHLVFSNKQTLFTVEYDGQNKTTVYSGPFEPNFLSVTSDGKLVILTSINPKKNKLGDLYTVNIK